MTNSNLGYCDYDFDTIVASLQDRLSNQETWKDIYRSSTGQMLIELLAYILNMGLFYTERRAEESFLSTAKNRSSVIALVSLLNYNVKRKTSALGNLIFTIPLALSKIVYIPKYTECQSVDGYKYSTNASAVIEKGQVSVSIESIQGESKQLEVTSNGVVNQEYLLESTGVEDSADTNNYTLRVLVDGNEWTKVSSFINSDSSSKHYRVITEMDETITVIFGDNVNGLAPSDGSVIVINYIESDGLDGNIASIDKITSINDTIYDEDGTIITSISVTNADAFLGGDVAEDIEEIRYEAPRVFKTGDRAVSKTDFISIIENYSGVASANVWGENEEALAAGVSVDYEMLNKVKICIVLQEWELPGTNFKSTLSAYIYDKSMLTVKYEFVTPTILLVIPTLRITAVEGSSLTQTQADVESALAAQFLLGSTTKLGTMIKYSTVISAIHNLDDVAYTTMVLEIKKVLSDSYDSAYDWGATLDALDIKPESVRVFVDGVYSTVDTDDGDGTGTFSAVGITGDINYSTGVLTLDIAAGPAAVYVRYQQAENGNVVPTFRQICQLYDTDVTSIQIES